MIAIRYAGFGLLGLGASQFVVGQPIAGAIVLMAAAICWGAYALSIRGGSND